MSSSFSNPANLSFSSAFMPFTKAVAVVMVIRSCV